MQAVEQVEADAFVIAGQLGHSWVGGEHLTLALLELPQESAVRQALDQCRLRAEDVRGYVASIPPVAKPREGRSPNPRFYGIVGRAEGFAVASGTARPRPEHFLLALIWESSGLHGGVFRHAHVTPAQVQAALAGAGVAVPDLEPPPFDDTRWGERVPITPEEYRDNVPGLVYRLLPDGTTFGCNMIDGEAWIVAEEGVDLAPYLAEVRERGATQ
jgi:DNA-binding transcriptional LysR family regulator